MVLNLRNLVLKTIATTVASICLATSAQAQTLTQGDRNILGSPDSVRTSVWIKIGAGASMENVNVNTASLHRVNGKHYVCGTMNFMGERQRFVLSYAHKGPSIREYGLGPRQVFLEVHDAYCGARSKVGDFAM